MVEIVQLMLKNASSLKFAHIGRLSHDLKQGIVYKNLEDLTCGNMHPDAAKPCSLLIEPF